MRPCITVGGSVRPSICLSVHPSVTPSQICKNRWKKAVGNNFIWFRGISLPFLGSHHWHNSHHRLSHHYHSHHSHHHHSTFLTNAEGQQLYGWNKNRQIAWEPDLILQMSWASLRPNSFSFPLTLIARLLACSLACKIDSLNASSLPYRCPGHRHIGDNMQCHGNNNSPCSEMNFFHMMWELDQ